MYITKQSLVSKPRATRAQAVIVKGQASHGAALCVGNQSFAAGEEGYTVGTITTEDMGRITFSVLLLFCVKLAFQTDRKCAAVVRISSVEVINFGSRY